MNTVARRLATRASARPFLLFACLLLALSFVPVLRSGAAGLATIVFAHPAIPDSLAKDNETVEAGRGASNRPSWVDSHLAAGNRRLFAHPFAPLAGALDGQLWFIANGGPTDGATGHVNSDGSNIAQQGFQASGDQ